MSSLLFAAWAAGGGAIPRATPGPPATVRTPPPPGAGPIFVDAAVESGLRFRHFNGMTGNYTLAEIMGSGGALLDYDGDGDLDIFLVQGALLGNKMSEALFPWTGTGPPTSRLFRNDLTLNADGSRTPHFTEVTEKAGLAFEGYCMGATTGDFDNDGRIDLLVSCLAGDHLFRNRGNGTFEDVTAKAHVGGGRWSTSATFVDYDRDGFLDLYVATYVDFATDPKRPCFAASSARDFCGPQAYRPERHRLLHNRGDGTFEDVTEASGIAKERGAGLGVVAGDVDGDGWPDIFVGNDGGPNFLWMNQRDGTFKNEALFAGVAVNAMGKPLASMGVDLADADGDGADDLFVTNIMQDSATLFFSVDKGLFEDRTISTGLAAATRGKTGFGAGFLDWDNDGWLDLMIVNGAVLVLPEQARLGDKLPLRQPSELFRNTGRGVFERVTARAGPALAVPEVNRGALFGDIDNDGRMDVVVTRNNGPTQLLLNRSTNKNHWLGLRLLTRRGGRDALGARVEVLRPSGTSLFRRAYTDGSYLSARDPRVLVGLGRDARVTGLRVVWPGGGVETWPAVPSDRYVTLREGSSPRWE